MSTAKSDVNQTVRPLTYQDIYDNRGLIIQTGRKYGLGYSDCDEMVQEFAIMCHQTNKLKFNPAKAKLSTFLAVVSRNYAIDMQMKAKREGLVSYSKVAAFYGDVA